MRANLILQPPPVGCSDSDYRNPINIAQRLLMVIVIKGINFLWVVEGKNAPYSIHSGRLRAKWTTYATFQVHPRQAFFV